MKTVSGKLSINRRTVIADRRSRDTKWSLGQKLETVRDLDSVQKLEIFEKILKLSVRIFASGRLPI